MKYIALCRRFAAGLFAAAALASFAASAQEAQEAIQGVPSEGEGHMSEVVEEDAPFRMTEADRQLTARVIEALQADDQLRGRIAVSAANGVVILSGTVHSVPMIYRAVEIADGVGEVKLVNVDRLDRGSWTAIQYVPL